MIKIFKWIILLTGAVFIIYGVSYLASPLLGDKNTPAITEASFSSGLLRTALIFIYVIINYIIGYYYYKFVGIKLLKL